MSSWPVWVKLVAVLALPALATMVLGGLRIGSSLADSAVYDRAGRLADLGAASTALVHAVETERDLTAVYIAHSRGEVPPALSQQQSVVDEALTKFEEAAHRVDTRDSTPVSTRVNAALSRLPALLAVRDAATSSRMDAQSTVDAYSGLLADLIAVEDVISEGSTDKSLVGTVRALGALSRAKELVSREGSLIAAAVSSGQLSDADHTQIVTVEAQVDQHLADFRSVATPEERQLYDDTVTGRGVDQYEKIEATVRNTHSVTGLQGELGRWLAAAKAKSGLMRQVEQSLNQSIRTQIDDLRGAARYRTITNGLLVLGIIIAAVLVSLWVARLISRPLKRLQSNALDVAERQLPAAIDRINRMDQPIVEPAVDQDLVHTRDEIGQVARSFEQLYAEALRLATEQAALRSNISAMFINLSRRSQGLVERQLRLIDELESSEQSKDQLANLFTLDHLATRMRRNSENLLVLAGAEEGRRWPEAVPLVDVLRAAISEVEQYSRIALSGVPDHFVTGNAVNHLAHLLAELIENATAFSSPSSVVQVHSQALSDGGVIIEIADRGIGMTREEIDRTNSRLADPPVLDVAVSRTMGLVVVGRLARRHNITVRLRRSDTGGITAFVRLPATLLAEQPETPRPVAPGLERPLRPAAPGPPGASSGPPALPSPAVHSLPWRRLLDEDPSEPAVREPFPRPWERGRPSDGVGSSPSHAPGNHAPLNGPANLDGPASLNGPQPPVAPLVNPVTPVPQPPLPRTPMDGPNEPGFGRSGGPAAGGPFRSGPGPGGPAPGEPAASRTGGPRYVQPNGPTPVLRPDQPTSSQGDQVPIYDQADQDPSSWFRGPVAGSPAGGAQPDGRGPTWGPASVDSGWQAAEQLRNPPLGGGTTRAGLPRRVPRAQLVPGVAGGPVEDQPAPGPAVRRPDDVRHRLASYHQGVERARHSGQPGQSDEHRPIQP